MSEGILLLLALGSLSGGYKLFDYHKRQNAYRKFHIDLQQSMNEERFVDARNLLEKWFSDKSISQSDTQNLFRIYLARCYYEEKRYVDALKQADRALRVFKQHTILIGWSRKTISAWQAAAHETIAECFDKMGEDEKRDKERQKAGDLYSACGQADRAHFLFGRVLYDLGDYTRAVRSFQDALNDTNCSKELQYQGHLYLAMSFSSIGRFGQARRHLLDSLSSQAVPSARIAIHGMLATVSDTLGDIHSATEFISKAVEYGESPAYVRIAQAKIYMNAGRLDAARLAANEAHREVDDLQRSETFQTEYEAYTVESESARMQGDWSSSRRVLSTALDGIRFKSARRNRYYHGLLMFQQAVLLQEQALYADALVALNDAEPEVFWHPRLSWDCASLRLLLQIRLADETVSVENLVALESRMETELSKFESSEGMIYHAQALTTLGECWCAVDEPARGRKRFEQVSDATKTSGIQAKYWFKIASCYEAEGNIPQAIAFYESAANVQTEERHGALAQKRLVQLQAR